MKQARSESTEALGRRTGTEDESDAAYGTNKSAKCRRATDKRTVLNEHGITGVMLRNGRHPGGRCRQEEVEGKYMGMDLIGDSVTVFLSNVSWLKALRLAEQHGWAPAGTVAPGSNTDCRWSGTYWSNDGQQISAADAAAFAAALERALEFVPEQDTGGEKWIEASLVELPTGSPLVDAWARNFPDSQLQNVNLDPNSYFSGQFRHLLFDLILVLRSGSVTIW